MAGKYQAYPEYKDTGIKWFGSIPIGWDIAALRRSLLEHKQGYYTTESYVDEGIKLLRITDLRDYGEIDIGGCPKVPSNDQSLANYDLKDGDVVFARTGGAGSFGVVKNLNERVVFASYLIRFRFCENSFINDYLRYMLLADSFQKAVKQNVHGGVNQNIHAEDIKNSYLARPPLGDQQKIANFLDHETAKIDTLIEKQQQLIKLLKDKRQAVISHAVTKGLNPNTPMRDSGVEWLGEVPVHWVKKMKLSNVSESNRGSFVNGPFGSDLLANELRDEGVPVVYIRDIKRTGYKRKSTVCVTPKKAEQLEVCKVVAGDVIISKVGDPPGDACIYPEGEPNAIITQDVIRIRVDHAVANPEYIVMLLNSDFGQMVMNDISVEGTRKRVSLGDFKATKFVMPPLNDQDYIIDYVHKQCRKMDALIGKSDDAVNLIRERRTALISAAVTGKIDVRNWQAPIPSNTNNKEVAA